MKIIKPILIVLALYAVAVAYVVFKANAARKAGGGQEVEFFTYFKAFVGNPANVVKQIFA